MEIKLELLRGYISDFVKSNIYDLEIDAEEIVETRAVQALAQIQEIVKDSGNTDFEAMEKIVVIFEKYGLSFSPRHDF